MPVEKERRHFVSLGNVLTLLVMAGGVAGTYAALASDNASTKERLATLEKRNDETRTEIKSVAHEIKWDVKEVKGDVQLILRKLDAMEAVQRHERRERRVQ